jgi:hypothetical protein
MNPQHELEKINDELERLLSHGDNDEKLVSRKRELEAIIRKSQKQ